MVRLAGYSRGCLRQLRADTGIRYDERSQRALQLFRTQKQFDGTAKDIEILKQCDVPIDDASHAPESTLMDETHKVAVTRLGDRIRVGGTGHGTLGWTMAAGTGRVMADLISAKPTGISLDGLTVDRYGQAFTKPHRSAKHRMAARAGALKQRLNSPDDFQACSPRVVQDANAQGARGGDCAGGQSAAG